MVSYSWLQQTDLTPTADPLVEGHAWLSVALDANELWRPLPDVIFTADPLVDDAGPTIAYHNVLQSSDLNPLANPLVEADAGPTEAFIPASSVAPTVTVGTTSTFAGPTFASVGSLNGGLYMIPPDNASAVGVTITNSANPHNGMTPLVLATNGEIEFVSSTGALLAPAETLDSFFNTTGAFDPKVTYDPVNHRFVVVALVESDSPNTSDILVAVSKHNDPSLGWNFMVINSETQVAGDGGGSWADFPGLATDGKAIYITTNLFSHTAGDYEGSRLWIISDGLGTGGIYDGGSTSSVQVYDPSVLSGASSTSTDDLFTLQPAQIYGASPFASGSGTFLVAYNGDTLQGGSGNALDIIEVRHPLTTPTFTYQQVGVGNIDAGGQFASFTAPQLGTTTPIDANDNRMLSVVYDNGHLYAAADVLPPSGPDAGHVTAHWFNLSTANLAQLTIAGQGDVSGSAIGPGVRTYFPSIVADGAGDFVVNVSASGPSLYAGAYYAVHLAGDSPNSIGTPISFAAGVAPYVRTFGYGDNRWGDFSSLTREPGTKDFFAFNESAAPTGNAFLGENGQWATTVAEITLGTTAAPTVASNNPSDGVFLGRSLIFHSTVSHQVSEDIAEPYHLHAHQHLEQSLIGIAPESDTSLLA